MCCFVLPVIQLGMWLYVLIVLAASFERGRAGEEGRREGALVVRAERLPHHCQYCWVVVETGCRCSACMVLMLCA